jgi:Fe-S cluster assembly protein SufD
MSLATALENRDVSELPGRRDEDWRWTDLRGLLREIPPPSPVAEGWSKPGPFGTLGDDEVLIINGHGGGMISIENGETETIRLRFVSAGERTSHMGRAVIQVAEGGRLTLLESHEGEAASYVADIGIDFDLAEGAVVERIVLASDQPDAINVVDAHISTAPGSHYSQTVLTTGARRQRIETTVHHGGGGAVVHMDGAYLLTGKAHADQTTVVVHAGPGGATSQLVKGAVADQARGVFQGRIVVETGADQTDAKMGHHALILSDKAEVDAKPELLIHADEVSCSHGNTVGALDDNALFYARQRGIPEAEARAMLTAAFVGEVVDRIDHEAARDIARTWVTETLRGL